MDTPGQLRSAIENGIQSNLQFRDADYDFMLFELWTIMFEATTALKLCVNSIDPSILDTFEITRKPLLNFLSPEKWFDLAISINKNSKTETYISVISNQGEAYLKYDKKNEQIYYYNLKGNVLLIPESYHANLNNQKFITKNEALSITANTPYPDSLWRIVEATSSSNFDFPDFILSLKDGYYLQSSLGAFTKMYRTHGSQSANSSFGILASNRRKIPGQIRSKDILHFLKIDPRELFGKTYQKAQQKDSSSHSELMKNSPIGIETQAKDFSQKRIFQFISRFVTETRPYFVVSKMKSFMNAFKFDPSKSPESQFLSPMNFNISKFDIQSMISPEDIGELTDAVLTSPPKVISIFP